MITSTGRSWSLPISLRGRRWKEKSSPGARQARAGPTLFIGGVEERLAFYTSLIRRRASSRAGTCSCFSPITRRQAPFSPVPSRELSRRRLLVRQLAAEKRKAETLLQGEGRGGAPDTGEQELRLSSPCRERPCHCREARRRRVSQRGGFQVQRGAPGPQEGPRSRAWAVSSGAPPPRGGPQMGFRGRARRHGRKAA